MAKDFGLDVSWPNGYLEALTCDIVHIQKILSLKIIWVIFFYRLCGITVVFDIDDQPGKKIKSFLGCLVILYLASVVTVDSDARRDFWKKYLLFKKIVVINDVADTTDLQLKINIREDYCDSCSFFWIGHASNILSIEKFIEFVTVNRDYSLTICTNEKEIPALTEIYPVIRFIPWSRDVAFENSINARFMVLNHNFDQASLLKSENKMVLSILAGFIPLVSRTPAYEKLANSLNADFLIFDSLNDVPTITNKIASADFQLFSSKNFSYIEANYSKSAVLAAFISKVLVR
ncbi:MAG: hypothetical protein DWI28_00560 [Planctomycetota bacterium]|nr:MAG: hypothetical protein DWI28_00560 [Planctomycetota bacterium]